MSESTNSKLTIKVPESGNERVTGLSHETRSWFPRLTERATPSKHDDLHDTKRDFFRFNWGAELAVLTETVVSLVHPLGHPSATIKDCKRVSSALPTISRLRVVAGSGFTRPRTGRVGRDKEEAAVLSRSRSTAAAAAAASELCVEQHGKRLWSG